ncbi:MAG: MBL fold metallo-hydrolase [Ruminococcus sp.]|nr:MBL fold metallo-hydrolase [Ruminococcus sp.]
MARIYPLFSSSDGNCTYIGNGKNGILVDAGVTCKRICDSLSANDISTAGIHGIFITHTHSDHVKGLNVFLKKHRIPVYASRKNISILLENKLVPDTAELYEMCDEAVCVGDFSLSAFETLHDTPSNCGYRITCPDGKVAAVCTDLGIVTQTVWENIKGCDLVLLESNYDPYMLAHGPYPLELQRRISSDHGHLSNPDCADTLAQLVRSGTDKFILGHLSQHNNDPKTAENTAVGTMSDMQRNKDYLLHVAKPDGNGLVVAF